MPGRRTAPKGAKQYIATESFTANVDSKGNVTTDGSGTTKAWHADRTRVFEGDPILDHMPEEYFILVEDHQDSM